MKNRLLTNTKRYIYFSFPRFIALMIMSFLGVFVYAGLQATSPDMMASLDQYLDTHHHYDIKVISTLGLVDEDVTALKNIKNVENVEGFYSKDVAFENKGNDYVINVSSYSSTINTLEVIEGKLPSSKSEIVVEEKLQNLGYEIGDTIELNNEDLIEESYTITGFVDSSLYFNSSVGTGANRGTTTVGNGTIDFYGFLSDDAFNLDYYTNIYLTVKNASSYTTNSSSYNKLIDEVTSRIKTIQSTQQTSRDTSIKNDANKEIDEVKEKYYKKLETSKNKLDDAKKELDASKKQLDQASSSLNTFKEELDQNKEKLDETYTTYQSTLAQYNLKEDELLSTIDTLQTSITQIQNVLGTLDVNSALYKQYNTQLTSITSQLNSIQTLYNTKQTLDASSKSYEENLALYNQKLEEYNTNLESYNNAYKEYEDGLKKYNESKKEIDEKIKTSREELNDLESSKWYIYNRLDYGTYSDFIDDAASINNLSKIFPLVFYAVAVLVSLISMNRMVEDDRTEIGTLKSLGFSNKHILMKYLIFSMIATLIGGILGGMLGIVIIPKLIYSIYTILFDLPKFVLKLNIFTTFIGFIISFICVCGTTTYTVLKELKEKPSELLRPKAPKAGKRILLERVTLIWSHISFSNKVTIRNIFRYKKRVLVTIIGIIGCTALVLSGFGIKDSIVDIPTKQFGETFTYDGSAYMNNASISDIDTLFDDERVSNYVPIQNEEATLGDSSAYLFMSNEDTSSIVNLIDTTTSETIKLEDDKVIITEKLAELEGINTGDTITFKDNNHHEYTMEVQGIVHNYVEHYIFMNIDEYIGETKYNVVYFNMKEDSSTLQQSLKEDLLKDEHVISVSYIQSLIDKVSDMLKSLDKVVIILVVLASMLSFVVLYNLANININERKREVATIKVLGFYDNEVDSYINKEMIILTIIGIVIGIVVGIYLTNIVVSTVEIEKCRFIHQIKYTSYIYAVLISMMFTVIVSVVTHFILRKIDMVESLKSVE